MSMSKPLIAELAMEAANTKKIFERIPFDQLGWKPHEKSMPMGRLATHVAELPGWITMTINTDEFDLAAMTYKPTPVNSNEELIALLDKNVQAAVEALEKSTDEDMMKIWTLRNGDHIIFQLPKVAVIRGSAMNHSVHHRGQLTTYLRQHNIPVPGMYGPSADEMN
jgi:uncharacterized damage-inducible protein DinB